MDKMKQNKRAFAVSPAVLIILAIIVGIILLAFGQQTLEAAGTDADIRVCRASAFAGSYEYHVPVVKGGIWRPSIESPVSLKCETHYARLSADGIYLSKNLAKFEEVARFYDDTAQEEVKDELKRFVFDQLYDCWYSFGSGKAKVINKDENLGGRFCFVCSEFLIDEKFKEKYGSIVLDDMYEFAKKSDASKFLSYFDFLTDKAEEPASYPAKSFALDKQMSVVFQAVVNEVAKAKLGSGIVDCSVAGHEGVLNGEAANEVGCNSDGTRDGTVDGLVFGKVIDGGTLTVRIVPTKDVDADTCKDGLY